jgi:hypothetical protein
MAISLATAIENYISDYIATFAKVGGASLDPDLSTNQQLLSTDYGYGILQQERSKGALVRVEYIQKRKNQDAGGMGTGGREEWAYGAIQVHGLSKLNTSPRAACIDAKMIDQVIFLHILGNGPGSNVYQSSNTARRETAAILSHVETNYWIASDTGTANTFAGMFTQIWQLTSEAFGIS